MKDYRITVKEIKDNNRKMIELLAVAKSSATTEARAKSYADIKKLKVVNAVLRDNARLEYIAEYLPKALAILEKYNGKRIGEKTKDKITEEAKSAGFLFWIRKKNYGRIELDFAELNEQGYSNCGYFGYNDLLLYCKDYEQPLYDENGKMCAPVDAESYGLYDCTEYSDNPTEKADEIINAFNELEKAGEQYKALENKYNNIKPSAFNGVYINFPTYMD